MACLSYAPSTVEYKNKSYSRGNLLLLRTRKVVDLLKKVSPLETKNFTVDLCVNSKTEDLTIEDFKPRTKQSFRLSRKKEFVNKNVYGVPKISLPSPKLSMSQNVSFRNSNSPLFVDEKLTNELLDSDRKSNNFYLKNYKRSPFVLDSNSHQTKLKDRKISLPLGSHRYVHLRRNIQKSSLSSRRHSAIKSSHPYTIDARSGT